MTALCLFSRIILVGRLIYGIVCPVPVKQVIHIYQYRHTVLEEVYLHSAIYAVWRLSIRIKSLFLGVVIGRGVQLQTFPKLGPYVHGEVVTEHIAFHHLIFRHRILQV